MKPFETVRSGSIGSFLFSCEHASNHLPSDVPKNERDDFFLQTHWGIDIGAAQVLRHLSDFSQSEGILATHSRLWMDLNRASSRSDIIRLETEGHFLSFNQNLHPDQIRERFEKVYYPFHQAFDQMVKARLNNPQPVILLSIHSFTPIWEGCLRSMDMGVLFDDWAALAHTFKDLLVQQEFFTELNQPYTGKNGLMYSVQQPGRKYNIPHLELEINQALISTPERCLHIAQKIWLALQQLPAQIT